MIRPLPASWTFSLTTSFISYPTVQPGWIIFMNSEGTLLLPAPMSLFRLLLCRMFSWVTRTAWLTFKGSVQELSMKSFLSAPLKVIISNSVLPSNLFSCLVSHIQYCAFWFPCLPSLLGWRWGMTPCSSLYSVHVCIANQFCVRLCQREGTCCFLASCLLLIPVRNSPDMLLHFSAVAAESSLQFLQPLWNQPPCVPKETPVWASTLSSEVWVPAPRDPCSPASKF